MKRKVRAVVFDLYSTLIFIRNDKKAFKRLLGELGGNTKEGYDLAKRIAFTKYFSDLSLLAKRINPKNNIDLDSHSREISAELTRVQCFAETVEVLTHLRKKKIALGLISNVQIPYHKPFFDLGLRRLFDEYIFSCEAGITKPDPEIYKLMLEKLGVDASDVLMVGDSSICDVSGPKSVGMNAVLLDRNSNDNSRDAIHSLHGIYPLIH
jgi:HAD superfamily hydrolase (TIGR01549 family)